MTLGPCASSQARATCDADTPGLRDRVDRGLRGLQAPLGDGLSCRSSDGAVDVGTPAELPAQHAGGER